VNDQVLLQMQFPQGPSQVTAVGQVIWRKAKEEGGAPEEAGMGLQFLEATPETLEAIEEQMTRAVAAEVREVLDGC
jgi:Tfp pilus assembly protein PilZ